MATIYCTHLSSAVLGGALRRRELATAFTAALAHVAIGRVAGTHWVSSSRDRRVESLMLGVVGGMRRGTWSDLLGRWVRLASTGGDEVLS